MCGRTVDEIRGFRRPAGAWAASPSENKPQNFAAWRYSEGGRERVVETPLNPAQAPRQTQIGTVEFDTFGRGTVEAGSLVHNSRREKLDVDQANLSPARTRLMSVKVSLSP